jgi:hypothetical protein
LNTPSRIIAKLRRKRRPSCDSLLFLPSAVNQFSIGTNSHPQPLFKLEGRTSSQIKESLTDTEIFGSGLSLIHAKDMDEVVASMKRTSHGNWVSLFTGSGGSATRSIRSASGKHWNQYRCGAPMAYFPFSSWKGSFFGDLHAQGRDGVEFYTDKKVVGERWAAEHSRKF